MKRFLLVIDMLNDFIDPIGALFCGPTALAIVDPIKDLIKTFRENGHKVYFLCDNHAFNDKEFERFPKHAIEGGWGQEIIDGLVDVSKDIIIPKTRYSAFYNTNLEKNLLLNGYLPSNSEATVVGVCTNICVMDSVGWLANMDYSIKVPKNCVADFDQSMHEFALTRMQNLYGVNTDPSPKYTI